MKWVVAFFGLGISVMLAGCGQARNLTMMDDPLANHQSGGQSASGLNYTLARKPSESLQQLQQNEPPPTPANLQAAQDLGYAQIYFFKSDGHTSTAVDSAQDANYLGLRLNVLSYGSEPLNYEIPINLVQPGKKVKMRPSQGTPREYEAFITASDASLSDFMLDTDIRMSSGNVAPMSHQTLAPNASTASHVSLAPATIKFMGGSTLLTDLTSDFLAQHPEVNYLKTQFSTPHEIPAVSKLTLYGSTLTKLIIPLDAQGDKQLCIQIPVVETNEKMTPAPVTCGQDLFSAMLIGNDEQGRLLLELDMVSKDPNAQDSFFLSVDMNNSSGQQHQYAATTISAQQLNQKVNSQAYVKVDLSQQRTLLATSYLEEDAENPEVQKIIGAARRYWWQSADRDQKVAQSFFAHGQPVIQKGLPAYEKFDLPADMSLVSLIESGPFWTNGTIQGGPKKNGDCAIGPMQIEYGTAVARANDSFPGITFRLIKAVPVDQKGLCIASALIGRDDRTDFAKASMLAAAEMQYLFNYFESFKAPNQKIVDPKLIIAAYNWGEGSVTRALSRAAYHKTTNKSQATPRKLQTMRAKDGNFERFLLTARVYPNFWTLRKMHILPTETQLYVEQWLAIREINQNPSQYLGPVQVANKN